MTGRERTERLTVASSETVSLAMTGQAERSWTASMAMTGQFVSSEVDAAASGGSAAIPPPLRQTRGQERPLRQTHG